MDFLKSLMNFWFFAGAAAGFLALPKVLSGLGQFGWDPNLGFRRPLGPYAIGSAELTPLVRYRGGMGGLPELTPLMFYRGSARQLGQQNRSGENLLPFGIPGDYDTPRWMFAPEKKDLM